MSSKTEAELNEVIAEKSTFVEEARQAAIWELELRNLKTNVKFSHVSVLENCIKN